MTGNPSVTVGSLSAGKDLLTDLMRIRAPYRDLPWAAQSVTPLRLPWRLHAVAEQSGTGYDGALFSTEIDGKPHFLLFHQGTNHYRDMPSLARIVTGQEPQQMEDARRFTEYARGLVARKYPGQAVPIIQVGYSLGGPLAVLVAKPDEPVITYESPGVKEILDAKGIDTKGVAGHLLEILSPHATFINAYGTHVGKVLEAGPKFWQTERVSLLNYLVLSIKAHRRQRLCDGLEQLDAFRTVPAEETGRPVQPWDAFREYIGDYLGDNPSRRERALASTAEVIQTMGIDEKFIRAVGQGADAVFSLLSDQYIRIRQKERPMRIRTHPQVERAHDLPAPSFRQRVDTERRAPRTAPPGL